MNTNNNNTPSQSESLLQEIIATAKESPLQQVPTAPALTGASGGDIPPQEVNAPPPQKQKMSTAQLFRVFTALIGAALVFFGTFLAYVVLNPSQTQFFINLGINPADIGTILKKLILFVFGCMTFVISLIFFYYLFRFFYTKKEYRRSKIIYAFLSGGSFFLLFATVGAWIFLYQKIGAADFVNPNGGVILYDNEKLLSKNFKDSAKITDYSNMVGPLTLRFDLSSDARYVSKTLFIESFELDYDGDGEKDVEGSNPESNQSLLHTYDKKGRFLPQGKYIGIDRITRKPTIKAINLPVMNIVGIVQVSEKQVGDKKSVVFDASSLRQIGKIFWYTIDDMEKEKSRDSLFTVVRGKDENVVCLVLQSFEKQEQSCSKVFIVGESSQGKITGKLQAIASPENPFDYTFVLQDLQTQGAQVLRYSWMLDKKIDLGDTESSKYTFSNYGNYMIEVQVEDTNGNKEVFTEKIILTKPLSLVRSQSSPSLLKISEGLNKGAQNGSYDSTLQAYVLNDVMIGSLIEMDATDVSVRDYGYKYITTSWQIGSKPAFESAKFSYTFLDAGRNEILARHQFSYLQGSETAYAYTTERIIVQVKEYEITPRLEVQQSSSYVPATVRFDGSASSAKSGTISKFIYNFGEGGGDVEGDAIQTYGYNFPGEYMVRLIVVKDDGTRAETQKKIIVKEAPRVVNIVVSIANPRVGSPVDFSSEGSNGQIASILWDFGDGTRSGDISATHTYGQIGKYTVKLTITYDDGTLRVNEKEVVVE